MEEARLVCLNTDAEAAIFDGELTGSQIRNLSAALQVEVLDRTIADFGNLPCARHHQRGQAAN